MVFKFREMECDLLTLLYCILKSCCLRVIMSHPLILRGPIVVNKV